MIDEEGKLLYSAPEGVSTVYGFMSDGYAYYRASTGDVIVDKTGREHFSTTKQEEEMVSICGHGDGVFILRKEIKTFTQNGIYVSVIDADGNFLFPDQEVPDDWDTDFDYFGEGIFRSYNGTIAVSGCFLNAATGAIFREYAYDDEFITGFHDGEAYFKASGFNGMLGLPTVVTPDIFASEASYLGWHDSLTEADEETMPTLTLSLPEGVKLLSYGSFDNGLAPVILRGVDERNYYSVVDESYELQYEPVKLPRKDEYNIKQGWRDDIWKYKTDILYSDGRFLFYMDDPNDTPLLTDMSGGQVPVDVKFVSIIGFLDDFIYLEDGLYKLSEGIMIDRISLYDDLNFSAGPSDSAQEEYQPYMGYIMLDDFSIDGKWKNIGAATWGQAQEGAIITFNGTSCNYFSPVDSYAFYLEDGDYHLDCTSPLGDTVSSVVKIVDEDNIDIYSGSAIIELTRVG